MTSKNKIYLSLILFSLLGGVLVVFLIVPTYKDIQRNLEKITVQKQEAAFLKSKAKDVEKFKKDYSEIKKSLERIEALFARSEAPVNFISFLEKSSQDSLAPIEISYSLARKKDTDPWPFMTFLINSEAPSFSFFQFLEKIESGPYLVEVTNLNLSKSKEERFSEEQPEKGSFDYVRANLSLKVFTD
jgi:type III secretory pathway component EscR